MSAHFETYHDKSGKLRWRLKAGNGQIIAAASQGYSSQQSLQRSIAIVKEGSARIETYEDKAGEHRWRMRSSNGNIICAGEGYTQKASLQRGLKSIQRNAPKADIRPASSAA